MAEGKLNSLARQLLEEIGFSGDPSNGSSWKDNALGRRFTAGVKQDCLKGVLVIALC